MKAFLVQETDDFTGGIVFAKTNAQARRQGADEFANGDFYSVTCRRASWADQYESTTVPKLAYIANGWTYDCCGCGKRIEDDVEEDLDPVEHEHFIYCTPACRDRDMVERTEAAALEQMALAYEKTRLLKSVPTVTITSEHVYSITYHGNRHIKQLILNFTFPKAKHGGGEWRFDNIGEKPVLKVSQGDLPAWYEFRDNSKQ